MADKLFKKALAQGEVSDKQEFRNEEREPGVPKLYNVIGEGERGVTTADYYTAITLESHIDFNGVRFNLGHTVDFKYLKHGGSVEASPMTGFTIIRIEERYGSAKFGIDDQIGAVSAPRRGATLIVRDGYGNIHRINPSLITEMNTSGDSIQEEVREEVVPITTHTKPDGRVIRVGSGVVPILMIEEITAMYRIDTFIGDELVLSDVVVTTQVCTDKGLLPWKGQYRLAELKQ